MEPTPGTLLVASPELLDPNFADAVVLVLDSDESGALGVILNRPSQVPVAAVLASWARRGGRARRCSSTADRSAPTARSRSPYSPIRRTSRSAGARSYGAVGLIDLDSPVELVDGSVQAMRVFAGYAGWGAEQLVEEIAEGSWYVVASELDDVFRADVADLRRQVLRRQPGELAWVSTRPADPLMN